jgi:hypothetical protein
LLDACLSRRRWEQSHLSRGTKMNQMSPLVANAPTRHTASISRNSSAHWGRRYLLLSGLILGATGFAKLYSALGSSQLLDVQDPFFGLSFRHLMFLVGAAELVVAGICFFGRNPLIAAGLIAWLATNFLVYRIGIWWIGWKAPCGCLGTLTDALPLSAQTVESIMKVLLAYLLIGSYGLLVWHFVRRGRMTPKVRIATIKQA